MQVVLYKWAKMNSLYIEQRETKDKLHAEKIWYKIQENYQKEYLRVKELLCLIYDKRYFNL